MQTQINIPIHSFVDLITNSSSEIFISATSSTLEAVKKLVDALLTAGGCKFRADDLFEITLDDNPEYTDEDQDHYEQVFGNRKLVIVMKTKIKSPAAEEAAKIITTLVRTFDIDSWYNG